MRATDSRSSRKDDLDDQFPALEHILSGACAEILRRHLASTTGTGDHDPGTQGDQGRSRVGSRTAVAQVSANTGSALDLSSADDPTTVSHRRVGGGDLRITVNPVTRHSRSQSETVITELEHIQIGNLLDVDDQVGFKTPCAYVVDQICSASQRLGRGGIPGQQRHRVVQRHRGLVFEVTHLVGCPVKGCR